MWFTRVSINNPVFATMVMMALMVLGLFSYQRLSVEQMPDVSIPVAVVRTAYPGASAEAVTTTCADRFAGGRTTALCPVAASAAHTCRDVSP